MLMPCILFHFLVILVSTAFVTPKLNESRLFSHVSASSFESDNSFFRSVECRLFGVGMIAHLSRSYGSVAVPFSTHASSNWKMTGVRCLGAYHPLNLDIPEYYRDIDDSGKTAVSICMPLLESSEILIKYLNPICLPRSKPLWLNRDSAREEQISRSSESPDVAGIEVFSASDSSFDPTLLIGFVNRVYIGPDLGEVAPLLESERLLVGQQKTCRLKAENGDFMLLPYQIDRVVLSCGGNLSNMPLVSRQSQLGLSFRNWCKHFSSVAYLDIKTICSAQSESGSLLLNGRDNECVLSRFVNKNHHYFLSVRRLIVRSHKGKSSYGYYLHTLYCGDRKVKANQLKIKSFLSGIPANAKHYEQFPHPGWCLALLPSVSGSFSFETLCKT